MPKIIATTTTVYHIPRDDKKVKEERYALSDGRTIRIDTFKDKGTRRLAYARPNSPAGEWTHIPLTFAQDTLKECRTSLRDGTVDTVIEMSRD